MKKFLLLALAASVIFFVGCMESKLFKIGPQTSTEIGTFYLEATMKTGREVAGRVNIDELKKLADGGGELNFDDFEYLKIRGNIFKDSGIGRNESLLVVFEGKYVVDEDNATEFFTDMNIYQGNSWVVDIFNKGLGSEDSYVPEVKKNKDNSTATK